MRSRVRALGPVFAVLWITPALDGQERRRLPSAPSATTAEARERAWREHTRMRDASPFRGLSWRALGPENVGGRVETLAVDPRDESTVYVGSGSGNLFKSTNAGLSWTPIFEHEATFSIGELAIAPSNPDVLWLGTGEVLMARSSYAGAGMFRSDDAGVSWRRRGLRDTHHIARVVVHPEDPGTVWVAALGHLYSENEERGVFKTTDGGSTWRRVLFVDAATAAADIELDPRDPDVVYATTWERSRRVWGHTAHGEGSGVYRSADGGSTWAKLTRGLPSDDRVGRIDLAVAPTRPDTLYALVDHARVEGAGRRSGGEVYRSDDGGSSWRRTSEARVPAGYDFCKIAVSPDDAEEVYVVGQLLWRSTDGGASFEERGGEVMHVRPHDAETLHLDHHAVWIDPEDADHWWLGNDGGAYTTHDRGAHWLHLNTLPITEFYALNLDDSVPYRVFGGTQDNAAVYRSSGRDTAPYAWGHVYLDKWGGGDSYFTPSDPRTPSLVYYEHQFGDLRRRDLETGEGRGLKPAAKDGEEPLRRNWMTPFLISAHDPDRLYYGAQRALVSDDRGEHWRSISPDLTTDPGSEQQGNVPFGTLTSISESLRDESELWVGSDDGRVHFTTDGGETWQDVSAGLERLWVSRVVCSRHAGGRAYVSHTGYREDRCDALVFATDDRGESWRSIAAGLPAQAINVIAEDPVREDVLYVGTDGGVYVSLDRGVSWESLVADLPTTTVHDLAVHPRDGELVIATHGRGMYALDVRPLQAWTEDRRGEEVLLFDPRVALLPEPRPADGGSPGSTWGEAVFHYALRSDAAALRIEVRDGEGEVLRALPGVVDAGVHAVVWDLRLEVEGRSRGAFDRPPKRARRGQYEVVLLAGDRALRSRLEVR